MSKKRQVRKKDSLRVAVEAHAPLPVRMEEKPQEPVTRARLWQALKDWRVLVLVMLTVITFGLWAIFLFPHAYPTLDCGAGVTIALAYPRFLATGDEGQLELTIRNEATTSLTATVVVDFLGPLPVQVKATKASNIRLSRLPPGAESGASIPFHISQPPLWSRRGAVDFTVRLVEEKSTTTCVTTTGEETHRITLCPIHSLAGYFRWFRLTPLALVGAALWEWFKKRLPLIG